MAIQHAPMTIDDFYAWILREENIERDYEFIAGEIVDVVSSPKSSRYGMRMGRYIAAYVDDNNLGEVSGADGSYILKNERYIPDVGFIATANLPVVESENGYVPAAPDLAVEVVSPTDSQRLLMIKVGNYLAAGTLVWVVYPENEQVDVYESGKSPKTFQKTDTLDSGTVLPGFTLDLMLIFK